MSDQHSPAFHVPNPREVVTMKALWVWVAAVAVYIVAITGRTSFGVASVDALERFGVSSSAIAVFTSIQVGTYAVAQIPTGVAIDKFGPRTMLVVGALIMGLGQVILGFTSSYWVAVVARIFIGAGDATAFLSVMRILPYWFPLHRTPMFTQFTGALGQLGQFISAVPFMWFLGVTGWTAAFVSLGAVGILVALAASLAVADSPEKVGITTPVERPNSQELPIPQRLKLVFSSPTAWNSFFIHYTGMAPQPVFVMMWGVPLMTLGMGLSAGQAGMVLTLNTVFLILTGPLHGKLSARFSGIRDWVTLTCSIIQLACWAFFFASPTPRGLAGVIGIMAVLALMQPSSSYGFDKIRERMPHEVVATATGLANMGGFIAGMLGAQLMGVVLDHRGGFEWVDFQHAAWAVGGVWLAGFIGIAVTHAIEARTPRAGVRIIEVD